MGERKTILLVEYDALIALNETVMLKKQGYEVLTVNNAQRAVELVKEKDIDLILMDIDLGRGKMDGTEAAERILNEKDIPIVFLSSHTEREVVEKTEGIASYGYILKNSGETVMLASINMAFRLFEAKQQIRDREENLEAEHEKLKKHIVFIEERKRIDEERNKHLIERYEKMWDINVREKQIKELEKREDQFRRLFEYSTQGIVYHDADGTVIKANKAAEKILGLSQGELTGKNSRDPRWKAIHEDGSEYTGETHPAMIALATGKNIERQIMGIFHPEKNEYVWISVSAFPEFMPEGNRPYRAFATFEDITETKKREIEQSKHRRFTEAVFNAIQDTISVQNSNLTIEMANHAVHKLYREKGKIEGEKCYKVYFNRDKPCEGCATIKAFRTKKMHKAQKEVHSNGNPPRFFELFSYPIIDEKNEVQSVVEYGRDITKIHTQQLELKESEEKYKNIFTNSLVSLWEEDFSAVRKELNRLKREGVTDFRDYFAHHPEEVKELIHSVTIIDVNETGLVQYGAKTKEELLGSLSRIFNYSEESLNFFVEQLVCIAEGAKTVEKEEKIKTIEGKFLYSLIRVSIPTEHNKRNNVLVAITDITELKKVIEEKEFLMKELNHRVKNNLLMVSSLISLKDSDLGDSVDLSDLQSQIDAIQLVHEKLNTTDDMAHINFREYVQELIEGVFSLSEKTVGIVNDVKIDKCNTKNTISLGLIINEVAVNAVKHGFTDDTEAVFAIEMEEDREHNKYTLILSNNGRPVPGEIDFDNPETLGLRLISALVEQIGGTIKLQREPHPVFTIQFPVRAGSPPNSPS